MPIMIEFNYFSKFWVEGRLKVEFFDSHAHYDDEKFDEDRKEVISKIYEEGVTRVISAGYSIESSKKAIQLAKKNEFIYATCGVSPNDIPSSASEWKNQYKMLEELIKKDKVVAVGEIGLDYYWNKENKELQKEIFINQIELANKYNLPIVIHTRDAIMDTLEILKANPVKENGIFHCCPQNRELIKEALKFGFYISFAGPITFKSSKNAEEIIKLVPNNRILIETDSPYLAPEPVRGTRNDPRNVKYIAQKIADAKGISVQDVANITFENAKKILKIWKSGYIYTILSIY